MAYPSTNYTKPSRSSTGFGVIDKDTDALLLQNGTDYLLLQDGESNLLLGGSGEQRPINFSGIYP